MSKIAPITWRSAFAARARRRDDRTHVLFVIPLFSRVDLYTDHLLDTGVLLRAFDADLSEYRLVREALRKLLVRRETTHCEERPRPVEKRRTPNVSRLTRAAPTT